MITDEDDARAFCASRLEPAGLAKLELLEKAISEENARQNLVSAGSLNSIWQRHFADSLQLVDHANGAAPPLLDLGSGAGFPGLVLSIARPDQDVILIESRKRRVDWLSSCAATLELPNCKVMAARVEAVPSFSAGVITARAFAPLDKLLRLSARFSTPETTWLLPKGRSAAQELQEQPGEIRALFHVEQSQTDPLGGIIVGRGSPPVT